MKHDLKAQPPRRLRAARLPEEGFAQAEMARHVGGVPPAGVALG